MLGERTFSLAVTRSVNVEGVQCTRQEDGVRIRMHAPVAKGARYVVRQGGVAGRVRDWDFRAHGIERCHACTTHHAKPTRQIMRMGVNGPSAHMFRWGARVVRLGGHLSTSPNRAAMQRATQSGVGWHQHGHEKEKRPGGGTRLAEKSSRRGKGGSHLPSHSYVKAMGGMPTGPLSCLGRAMFSVGPYRSQKWRGTFHGRWGLFQQQSIAAGCHG